MTGRRPIVVTGEGDKRNRLGESDALENVNLVQIGRQTYLAEQERGPRQGHDMADDGEAKRLPQPGSFYISMAIHFHCYRREGLATSEADSSGFVAIAMYAAPACLAASIAAMTSPWRTRASALMTTTTFGSRRR